MRSFVSVLTPTYNRRLFLPQLLRSFRLQTYPTDRLELLVLDDGTDCAQDLLENIPGVRYLRGAPGTPVGAKRNALIQAARGDILVHMDDDDYYPPARVAHAVERLLNTGRQVAGARLMYVYQPHLGKVVSSGPYPFNHATGNTLTYTRAYAETHRYEEDARVREEPFFLDNYQTPLAELDARSTILAVVHGNNTADKRRMQFAATRLRLKDVVADRSSLEFYRYRLPKLLESLPPKV